MGDLGIFGGSVAEEYSKDKAMEQDDGEGSRGPQRCRRRRARRPPCRGDGASADGWPDRLEEKADGGAHADGAAGDGPRHAIAPRSVAGQPAADGAGGPLVQPTLRTKFADTALWVGNLTTESNGTAEVALDMPENLTTWRIKVWGMGHGTKVGEGQTDVITRKDLIVRLEAPRFFVQTDEVVLSAIVHNYLKTKKSVQVAMELGGKTLQSLDELDTDGRDRPAGRGPRRLARQGARRGRGRRSA